jgi:integrase
MPTSWILVWPSPDAADKRYRVRYRLGGKNSKQHYAGSFRTRREAVLRKQFIDGELASARVPNFDLVTAAPQRRTLAEAVDHYRSTRVDVAEATSTNMRVALAMFVKALGGDRRIDEVTAQDVADAIMALSDEGYARETLRQGLIYLGAVFEYEEVEPNPARDKRRVRLPRGTKVVPPTPEPEHVEAVFRLLPSKHKIACAWLDWSGARVSTVDSLLVGDYDEHDRRIRLRAENSKNERALWVSLPDRLAEAIEATLPPRDDRDLNARLFADSGADALRTSITKACKAAGVPHWSPHGLRRRRGSLLSKQGYSLAEVAERLGDTKVVTAEHYLYVLSDPREIDLDALLPGQA